MGLLKEQIVSSKTFEEHTDEPKPYRMNLSPEVVYWCNLLYLGKLLELIAERYNQEAVWGEGNS